jgi:hypothetical protein
MEPIISKNRIQSLGPHPEEAALLVSAAVSKDGRLHGLACGGPSRRARKRALVRTRLMDDIDTLTLNPDYREGAKAGHKEPVQGIAGGEDYLRTLCNRT